MRKERGSIMSKHGTVDHAWPADGRVSGRKVRDAYGKLSRPNALLTPWINAVLIGINL